MQNFPLNLLTFPLWWYTVGASIMWQWSQRHIHFALQKTGLVLFAHHLNEPLYQDYTRAGRILSFFLRLILLFYKSLVYTVKSFAILVIFAMYLLVLPIILIMIVFQILPGK